MSGSRIPTIPGRGSSREGAGGDRTLGVGKGDPSQLPRYGSSTSASLASPDTNAAERRAAAPRMVGAEVAGLLGNLPLAQALLLPRGKCQDPT